MRLFSKKRIDKERDSTRLERLQKAGGTALAVTAGAVFFHHSDIGKRFNEVSEAIIPIARKINNDLAGKNRRDLGTLKNAIEKNVGPNGSLLKQAIENNRKNNLERNVKLSSERGLVKNLKNIKQNTEGANVYKELKTKKIDPMLKKRARERLKNDPRFKHLSDAQIKQIVDNVYSKINENVDIDKIDQNVLKLITPKTFAGIGIDVTDQVESIKIISKVKNDRNKEFQLSKKSFAKFTKTKIKEEALEYESLSRATDTIYNKIDRGLSKLGIQVDSEYLLRGSKALRLKDLTEVDDNGVRLLDKINIDKNIMNVIDDKGKVKTESIDFKSELENLIKKAEDNKNYENLIVDKSIRIRYNKNGEKELFTSTYTDTLFERAKSSLKNTLPGNILFKGRDDYEQPIIKYIEADKKTGTAYLQKKLRNIADEDFDNRTVDMMIHISGKTHDIMQGASGELNISTETLEQKLVGGYKKRELKMLLGSDEKYIPEAYHNALAKRFDINQKGLANVFKNTSRKLSRFNDDDWGMNILENVRDFLTNSLSEKRAVLTLEEKQEAYSKIKYSFNKLNNSIQNVSNDMMNSLMNDGKDYMNSYHKDLLNSLMDGDVNEFFNVLNDSKSRIKNKNLLNLLEAYKNNSEEVLDSIRTKHIERSGVLSNFLKEYSLEDSVSLDIEGQLRIETIKDIFQSIDNEKDLTTNNVFNFISNLNNISQYERKTFKDIGIVSLYEKDVKPSTVNEYSNAVDTVFTNERLGRFLNRIDNNVEFRDEINADFKKLKSDFGIFGNDYESSLNEINYSDYSDDMFVNRSSIGKLRIKEDNENIKTKDIIKRVLREFTTAGRNDPDNISEITLNVQYMLDRLSYGVDSFGLGLSDASTASPIETVKNIATKRILPAMAIASAFSVANYESEKITGVSLKGAAANGLSNVDMGARRLLDSTHASSAINWLAETSVMHEYLFGQRHFNSYEEEQDWYDNGYSPVRGGRYWTFGSSSEFRGNSINYYEPNFVKRANSNYHDVSVYGSIDEKWAHSWIPTPQHPLAPVRNLLDPYWLERKHLKENDRPYPLTGKMFSEGTPWGAVLNPTIGEIIKPVRMLPEASKRLGKNGIDANAIIEKLNTRIKQRNNENDDLLIVRGSDIRNGEYVPYGHPESDEINYTVSNGKASILGYDYMDSIQDIGKYETPDGTSYYEQSYGKAVTKATDVNNDLEEMYRYIPSNQIDEREKKSVALIKNINDYIISRGRRKYDNNRNIEFLNNGPNKQEGTYVYRNLVNERTNFDEDYYASIDTKKMVDKSMLRDYGKDMIYSAKQLSGIYGFLSDKMFGENAYTYRYEQAGGMTSFTRGFWDASIGGIGGEFMEIARRFFPSEDRSRININPLRNNMPDWIPDTYHVGRMDCRHKIARIAGNSLELQIPTMHSNVA